MGEDSPAAEMSMEAPGGPMPASAGVAVATGLNAPMRVLAGEAGTLWVTEAGVGGDEMRTFPSLEDGSPTELPFGYTGRVLRVSPGGAVTEMATYPSIAYPEGAEGAAGLAMLNGTLYATTGLWEEHMGEERMEDMAVVVRFEDGEPVEVANTWDLEEERNPAGALVESHPYGITAGPDDMLWIADAAGNDLLRMDPETGDIELVAVFEAMEGPIPNAFRGGAYEIEPVPTAVAFDDAGNIFVSLLSGIPFLPEKAKVVRVTRDGQVSDYSTGLTMLTDLKTGPDGSLYAVSMGVFSEEGPSPNSGAVLRIGEGTYEVAVAGLSLPTSVAFDDAGNAYVTTNGLGAPGSGEVLRFDAVAPPMM
jgi:sugar lactone lactonase YvrE